MDDLQSEKAKKHAGAQLYAKDKRRMVALTELQAKRWQAGVYLVCLMVVQVCRCLVTVPARSLRRSGYAVF